MAYAIVLGIVHARADKNLFNKLTYKPNIDLFTKYATDICSNAEVDLSYGGGIDELKKFQRYLGNKYNIVVFNDRKGRSIFFKGLTDDTIKKIHLLFEDDHYILVTNIHGAFSINYYCDYCLKSSKDKITHTDCPYTCTQCYRKPPCSDCNRSFYGVTCFNTTPVYVVC